MAGNGASLENLPELIEHQDGDRSTPSPEDLPTPRLKGRKRLLQGLKRVGSSQSLLRLSRSTSNTYRGTGVGSISCISLSTTSASPFAGPWAAPYSSPQIGNGFSTAPTSIPSTPNNDQEPNTRFRRYLPGAAPSTVPFASIQESGSFARPMTATGVRKNLEEDYFSLPLTAHRPRPRRPDFDFWGDMPLELCFYILRTLTPKEIVRCSAVSKAWRDMCFDGQLWAQLDTTDYYRDIPAEALIKIIAKAGPFARDLNLRGCIQLNADRWRDANLSEACTNLENLSLEGCTSVHRHSIHELLYANPRLVHINMSGLANVTNNTLKIISQNCPNLELLNISWCTNMDARGLKKVIQRCSRLRDLRASELRGLSEPDFMLELFTRNSLERLILSSCDTLTDDNLKILIEGVDSEYDYLTGRRTVPPRLLKHLDISRCRNVTNDSVSTFAHNLPLLEGLRLSKCPGISDASLQEVLPTVPRLTHLDLEELDDITNLTLQELAKSPCATTLKHLSISYCENLGDTGMLPVIKACTNLRNLELDNTRISNLVLIEAAAMVRARSIPARSVSIDAATEEAAGTRRAVKGPKRPSLRPSGPVKPRVGLRMVVYDCQNVTWTGIQEVLSRNTELRRPAALTLFSSPALLQHTPQPSSSSSSSRAHSPSSAFPAMPRSYAFPTTSTSYLNASHSCLDQPPPTFPHEVIALKVFYGYQPTVAEHTRRVLRGDFGAAARLERKWGEYMMASEEAGAPGGFGIGGFGIAAFGGRGWSDRRRRRRAREAMMMHADEEGEGEGVGRRRRARSGGGCSVM